MPAAVRFGKALTKNLKPVFDHQYEHKFIMASCLALRSFVIAFSSSAADTKIEQAIRDLDAQWSKAAQSKDVSKTVSFYSDDAIVLPP